MPPLPPLDDAVWDGISGILTALALVFGFYQYMKTRQKKTLTYEDRNKYLLVGNPKGATKDVEIRFKGVPVTDIHVLAVRFANTGTMPIHGSDYTDPLRVVFNKEARILSSRVIDLRPGVLRFEEPNPNEEQNQRKDFTTDAYRPDLMNPGDTFTVELLVSNYTKHHVDGRADGLKLVPARRVPSQVTTSATASLIFIIGVAVGALGFGVFGQQTFLTLVFWILVFAGGVVVLLAVRALWDLGSRFRQRFRSNP